MYKFIGEDGSLGLKKGKYYDLTIVENCISGEVLVQIETGNGRYKKCPYSNIKKFRENWEKKNIIQDPEEETNIAKDIEILKKLQVEMDIETGWTRYRLKTEEQKAIENVLSELEIKDKMIDLMAQTLLNYGFVLIKSKKGLKEHFRKEVEKYG